ncbi:MAG: helix-turn-helix transcriptional regulator [Gammaproteobacteria bacterium]|jgi:DNA-binding CsgD family transcriptional regulator|nr:helix-turn-helix transcriptional regulator [Gammaproteobacteria bacterium]
MSLSSCVNYENQINQNEFISYDEKGRLTLRLETGKEYLTKREAEILLYILQGHPAKKIGQLLGISFRTVESYISMLKLKFRCDRKNELISMCIKLGMIRFSFEIE